MGRSIWPDSVALGRVLTNIRVATSQPVPTFSWSRHVCGYPAVGSSAATEDYLVVALGDAM
jgi:hypothetical protein